LSDHDSSRNLDTLKKFIDFSAEMGWPYSLVDANWNLISDDSMEQLVAHAEKKGVDLLFWYNSGGSNSFVTEEPRNRMHERKVRRAEFAKLQKLGVKGVKVDFFHADKQFMIQRYLGILEDAADHKIMVVFHGCTIPRGWARTWPNLMSMEAVRGAETYTFGSTPDYGKLAPRQNTLLPVTRNVIGSMDYTPVVYSKQMIARHTTNAHETAHMIASGLRSPGWNGFYLGSGRGYMLPEPAMRLQDVKVPLRHRGWRHDTYLVDQRRWWNDRPLYLVDEWVAYITGGSVALDDHHAGRGTEKSDCVSGCHEFMVYCDYLRQQLPADYPAREAFDSLFWSLLDHTLELHAAGRDIFKSAKSDRLAAAYTPPQQRKPELPAWRIDL
jgi:hypothetical protein